LTAASAHPPLHPPIIRPQEKISAAASNSPHIDSSTIPILHPYGPAKTLRIAKALCRTTPAVASQRMPLPPHLRCNLRRWSSGDRASRSSGFPLPALISTRPPQATSTHQAVQLCRMLFDATHNKNLRRETHTTLCGVLTKRLDRLTLHFTHLIF